MIRHVVLLRFKEEASAARRSELALAFAGLERDIAQIGAIEWGVNASAEGLDKGFTHCFVVSFAGAAERDAYLPHPAHQAFVAQLQPWLADVLVLDYAPAGEGA